MVGFCENKIKRLVKSLEKLDMKIGECLEFRPYPKGYPLRSEEFRCVDAYYIGVRIRGGVIPKKKIIDLTETRRIFFENFQDSLAMNEVVQQLVMNREVDLRVDYKKRENLPDEVRPKEKGGPSGIPAVSNMSGAGLFSIGN